MEAGTALAPPATRREALARERAAVTALVRQRTADPPAAPTRREVRARERAVEQTATAALPAPPLSRREALAQERAAAAALLTQPASAPQTRVRVTNALCTGAPVVTRPVSRREALAVERATRDRSGVAAAPTAADPPGGAERAHWTVLSTPGPMVAGLAQAELAPIFADLVRAIDALDGFASPGEATARSDPLRDAPRAAAPVRPVPTLGEAFFDEVTEPEPAPAHGRRRRSRHHVRGRQTWVRHGADAAVGTGIAMGVAAAGTASMFAYRHAFAASVSTGADRQDLVRHGALAVLLAVGVLVLRRQLRGSGRAFAAVVLPALTAGLPVVTTGAELLRSAPSRSTFWLLAGHPGVAATAVLVYAGVLERVVERLVERRAQARDSLPTDLPAHLPAHLRTDLLADRTPSGRPRHAYGLAALGLGAAVSAVAVALVWARVPVVVRLTQDDGLTLRAAVAGMLVTAALVGVSRPVAGRWLRAFAAVPPTVAVAVGPTLIAHADHHTPALSQALTPAQAWTIVLYPAGVALVTAVAVMLARLVDAPPRTRIRTTARVPQPG